MVPEHEATARCRKGGHKGKRKGGKKKKGKKEYEREGEKGEGGSVKEEG